MIKSYSQFVLAFLLFLSGTIYAQVSLTALDVSNNQNFDSLASSGTTNTVVPQGWMFLETGTNANNTYAAGTGSSNTGNTYSLGLDSDRAFGGLQSGSLVPTIGASFLNNTGTILTALHIVYTGEQWRLGATPRAQADRLDFQISYDATSLSTGTWTDVDSLDFNSPILSGTVGALNGNLAANRSGKSYTIQGLSISPGATFWIRWTDFNVAGSDDALAVDDFSIMPSGIPLSQPTMVFSPASLNFAEVNVGQSKVLSYQFKGSNLESPQTIVNTTSAAFKLSLDQVSFYDSILLFSDTTIYVRFTSSANGLANGSLVHINGSLTKSIPVSGSGYDPNLNIIPIATARGQSTGTKVTIAGRVTASNQFGSPSYVQDATGGIPVFDSNFSNSVSLGDTVIVTGSISVFNSQVEISGTVTFSKPDTLLHPVVPKQIMLNQLASLEGMLVTVQNVHLVNQNFVFYPQSTEQITNDSLTFDLRIDGDTDLPGLAKPQGFTTITGVVGRFGTNIQLLPRFAADVPGAHVPQAVSDSIPRNNTFDLMNWNLEFFGAKSEDYGQEYGPADETLQLQNVQRVISSAQADVIAVQEVSDEILFDSLVSRLPGYKGICSQRYSYSFNGPDPTFPPQKVCFIYDTTTVQVTSHRAMFESLYDAARTDNSVLPGYPTGDASSFWSSGRLPFMLTANVTINGVTEQIKFINVHAKSGSTLDDFNRRVYDAQVLKDSLDAFYQNDKVVVLGDLNDDLDQSIVSAQPSPYAPFVLDTARYNPITLALSQVGAKSTISFNDMIDQQILTNELTPEYIAGSVRVITPFNSIPNYGTTTSDHLPVFSRYSFIEPVLTFSSAGATVTEGSDSARFQLILSRALSVDKTILLNVQNNGGAVYGEDYTINPAPTNGVIQITIPAGQTTASISFRTFDDSTDEPTQSVVLLFQGASGIQAGAVNAYILTILDNDPTSVNFAETEVTREEGSGAYTVMLNLSTPLEKQSTVVIGVSDGPTVFYGEHLDYVTSPAVNHRRITLTAPQGADSLVFTVTPNQDRIPEHRPESVDFRILSATDGLTVGIQNEMIFNIKDVRVCHPEFLVYPNATFGDIHIATPPDNEDDNVEGALYGPAGEILVTATGTVEELSRIFSQSLHERRRGFYILRLTQCGVITTVRIAKI